MGTDSDGEDEVSTDVGLVGRLLGGQFPQWGELPITPVRSAGTDNAIYRLGDELVARLPRLPAAVAQHDAEHRWLPRLAPRLPLDVPTPIARGAPAGGYPWPWSVYRWLDGETAGARPIDRSPPAAAELGRFVAALQRVSLRDGPPSGRGRPLAERDEGLRPAIAALEGTIDTDAVLAAWERALRAPPWRRAPVWLHGDLNPGNLVTRQGRLEAVIDFGGMGVGDPAGDVMAAWMVLSAATRDLFRAAVRADDATWERARGVALAYGVDNLPYYRERNPVLAAIARRAIDEVLADRRG